MPGPHPRYRRPSESGGITIVVALMLLILLTTAAVGMSRNALRDIVTVGFGRQGAMARNVAESGVEWAIYWMDLENGKVATSGSAAQKLVSLKTALLMDDTRTGSAFNLSSSSPTSPTAYTPNGTVLADMTLVTADGSSQGYTLGLTRMGKLPIVLTSQGMGASAYTPAAGGKARQAPDLWATRADAQVTQTPVTFVHAKEVWFSTPVQ